MRYREELMDRAIDFYGIRFTVKIRNVRYYRLELSHDRAVVTAPVDANVRRFLEHNRERIMEKRNQINRRIIKSREIRLHSRSIEAFKGMTEERIIWFSKELNVSVKRVKFRKMKRTLGNCRQGGIVTLNSKLRFMSPRIIDYIIYHELLHLKVKGGHSKRFKNLIRLKFPDIRELDERIRLYLLKIDYPGGTQQEIS